MEAFNDAIATGTYVGGRGFDGFSKTLGVRIMGFIEDGKHFSAWWIA